MLCLNDTSCLNGYRCVSDHCVYSNEYYLNKHNDSDYNSLTLPIIEAILHDHPSLRNIYFFIFFVLIFIGLINNIFSLMTFIRDRIRYTICGIYLIIYSICSLILMILIFTNLITVIYYNNYFFRLWACHGYPYLSLIMVYINILISTAIAIESVLNKCLNIDKFRSRKRPIILLILFFIIVSISNLDKIFARNLITTQSGHFYCIVKISSYKFSSRILLFIYIIIPCLIHFISLICLSSMRIKENCIRKIFIYRKDFIPSLFIILCLFVNGLYRYLFHFNSTKSTMRLHIGFIFLLYIPQIFTYIIYVLPDDFYVKEFYQIWFYRKLCCCFYNKKRHIQKFEVIHRLWQRRTSLETIKTISNLDDTCIDSEFYRKTKTGA